MPISTYTVGVGTLTLGVAGVQDASAQVTNCRVEWSENVTEGERTPVLSGDELVGVDQVSRSAVLAGNIVQDIDAAGLVAYTWDNAGVEVPFEFTPNTAEARAVSGTVRLVPLTLGGDVKTKPQSDFSWQCIGDPVLGAVV